MSAVFTRARREGRQQSKCASQHDRVPYDKLWSFANMPATWNNNQQRSRHRDGITSRVRKPTRVSVVLLGVSRPSPTRCLHVSEASEPASHQPSPPVAQPIPSPLDAANSMDSGRPADPDEREPLRVVRVFPLDAAFLLSASVAGCFVSGADSSADSMC